MSDILRRIDRPGSVERADPLTRSRALSDSTRRRVGRDDERDPRDGQRSRHHQPHEERPKPEDPITGAYDPHGRRDGMNEEGTDRPHVDIVV